MARSQPDVFDAPVSSASRGLDGRHERDGERNGATGNADGVDLTREYTSSR